ncbi:hypothetical protein PybrP1_002502 [[Pythium] brassicae (nom. inval.)]|nr:hypothetical protein PybrP1_002502 [[Pythium] brassicae (nom. inval.)]
MEAWGAMLQRRRDPDADATGMRSSTASSSDPSGAYELCDVAVDTPMKKPQTIEALLTSRAADGSGALLVCLGATDGALHCYLTGEPGGGGALRWLATHKRLFHACATFLDSWGVYLTLADSKLALYALPLESSVLPDGGAASALIKGISWGLGGGGGDTGRMLAVVDETKHTTLFAAHERAKVVCCLSKQGTLRVFDWTVNRTLELRALHELPALLASAGGSSGLSPSVLPVVKMIVMGESHLFLHFKREWCVLNVDSGKFIDVAAKYAGAALGLDTLACAVALPSRQTGLHHHSHQLQDVFVAGKHSAVVVALAVDNEDEEEATIIDEKMRANPQNVSDDRVRVKAERVLEFNVPPRAAYYHHPLLLLDQHDSVAVYNVATMQLLQRIPTTLLYGGGAALSVASPLLEATTPSHASPNVFPERRHDGAPATFFAVSSPFAVRLLTMKPIDALVRQASASRRLWDAVALCKLCPEDCNLSDDERRALFAEHACELFQRNEYRKAMALFLESGLDVMDVLALYPRDLLPRSSGGGAASAGSSGAGASSTLAWQKRLHAARTELSGDALVDSLLALILLLRHKHDALARVLPDTGRVPAAATGSNRAKLSGMRSSTHLLDKSLEVVDTVLLKCLVLICEKKEHALSAKRELMELVSRPNRCEMGEAEIFLRAHRQFKALLGFYATRKEHRKALELLEDLERTAAANEKAAVVSPPAATSEPSGAVAALPSDGDDSLQTSEENMVLITEYLQRLGQSKRELVFEFSRRVLAVKPALGLTIFTHRKVHEQKEDIDPASMLSHLKTCEIQASSSRHGGDRRSSSPAADVGVSTTLPLIAPRFVAIEYLTQVIESGKVVVGPRLHDEVVYLLLDAISTELHSGSGSNSAGTPTPGATATRLTSRVSAQRGLVGALRRKLMAFLEADSSAYHPERMLSRTPTEMVDERAALLSKLGRHHEVLQLYAVELKDASLAENYCNRCYDAKLADESIYSALLRLYLRPLPPPVSSSAVPALVWQRSGGGGPSSSPFQSSEAVAAAVSILNKYPERIDVPTALDLLPPDVPVASLA